MVWNIPVFFPPWATWTLPPTKDLWKAGLGGDWGALTGESMVTVRPGKATDFHTLWKVWTVTLWAKPIFPRKRFLGEEKNFNCCEICIRNSDVCHVLTWIHSEGMCGHLELLGRPVWFRWRVGWNQILVLRTIRWPLQQLEAKHNSTLSYSFLFKYNFYLAAFEKAAK